MKYSDLKRLSDPLLLDEVYKITNRKFKPDTLKRTGINIRDRFQFLDEITEGELNIEFKNGDLIINNYTIPIKDKDVDIYPGEDFLLVTIKHSILYFYLHSVYIFDMKDTNLNDLMTAIELEKIL